ncbi:MAG: glycosyl hydrolase, partial [Bacteroidetes bacterium]|nr:glycosyl hydrolase [Bacteroidota bacterium]
MKLTTLFLSMLICLSIPLLAQEKGKDSSPMNERTFSGLKLRNIGPAFASGRIADIAIHPDNENVWYIATGSSGVWKTENAGVTWDPIFDNYDSYSTGCITIDPNNPNVLWLGTGENVGGRHVAFGDGVYRSMDGGKSWKNMGLKKSEHISKIVVHPENSDVIWVAAQGPLWSSGGERGLYKSTDGGKTWKQVLGNAEWTGVTDIVIDPRNPDWMYAATWDRHRTVAAYMGGGPGSGIHRSTDGGETWEKLTRGIPGSNLG